MPAHIRESKACASFLLGEDVHTYAGSVEESFDFVAMIMYKASASCYSRHGKAALYGPVDKGVYPQIGPSKANRRLDNDSVDITPMRYQAPSRLL